MNKIQEKPPPQKHTAQHQHQNAEQWKQGESKGYNVEELNKVVVLEIYYIRTIYCNVEHSIEYEEGSVGLDVVRYCLLVRLGEH